jgi:hypothetical protein
MRQRSRCSTRLSAYVQGPKRSSRGFRTSVVGSRFPLASTVTSCRLLDLIIRASEPSPVVWVVGAPFKDAVSAVEPVRMRVGPADATGIDFLELLLLLRLSKLLLKVLLIPSTPLPADFLLRRILPCASTLVLATVLLASPGVEGAPGFSSEAWMRYHRKPSERSKGLSSSNESPPLLASPNSLAASETLSREAVIDFERSTTRFSILWIRATSQSRFLSLWDSSSLRKK